MELPLAALSQVISVTMPPYCPSGRRLATAKQRKVCGILERLSKSSLLAYQRVPAPPSSIATSDLP
jgi:hypothetical protein